MSHIKSRSNVLVGLACATGVGLMFMVPMYFTKTTSPLSTKEGPLTGSQTQRGVYLNTGTKDVGPDPDWDHVNRVWKGRRNIIEVPPDNKTLSRDEAQRKI